MLVDTVAFQQDVKKALIELAPLRWDRTRGQLRLARRLRIHVTFAGEELAEESRGGARGNARRRWRERHSGSVLARLVTQAHGLQAVGFEQLFGAQGRQAFGLGAAPQPTRRDGRPPRRARRPPVRAGSVLYFVSGDPEVNPHGRELVYELSRGGVGLPMPIASASPRGDAVSHAWSTVRFEVNRFYQPGLLQAESSWLWDVLPAPSTKSYPFELTRTFAGQPARLAVWLQGSTDVAAAPDHRVRVAVNGRVVGEVSWDGQKPHRLDGEIPPGILVDGANRLEIETSWMPGPAVAGLPGSLRAAVRAAHGLGDRVLRRLVQPGRLGGDSSAPLRCPGPRHDRARGEVARRRASVTARDAPARRGGSKHPGRGAERDHAARGATGPADAAPR